MTPEERQNMIKTLVEYTEINPKYFEGLSDERLADEYDRITVRW